MSHLVEDRSVLVELRKLEGQQRPYDSGVERKNLNHVGLVQLHEGPLEQLSVWLQLDELHDLKSRVAHENALDYHQLSDVHFVDVHLVDIVIVRVAVLVHLLHQDLHSAVV